MIISLQKDMLKDYLRNQLRYFFPDGFDMKGTDVDIAFDLGLERVENCFKSLSFPSYCDDNGQTFFSHMHADQYAQFLYYFANSLWEQSENKPVCDKVMSLNRLLHGFFFSYKGKLPDHFFLGHPLGTILGNAVYGDYLVVFHGVTVNTSEDDNGNPAPVLGKGLFLGAGAKIIGNKPVGDRVSVGVDALVYDKKINNDMVVIKEHNGNTVIRKRENRECFAQRYFRVNLDEL